MERYFKIDKFNTFYDWDLILTSKKITPPEVKTNYVDIDGMDGTLDLSEALTGEPKYKDRNLTATFWTDHGKRAERERLLRLIRNSLHGRKVKIVEPDDPDHYFIGRVKITSEENNLAYATITIEGVCDPWRYAMSESVRTIVLANCEPVDVVINNNGAKTVIPEISVKGIAQVTVNDTSYNLSTGIHKITDLRIRPGANVVSVSGSGSVTFTYREGDL